MANRNKKPRTLANGLKSFELGGDKLVNEINAAGGLAPVIFGRIYHGHVADPKIAGMLKRAYFLSQDLQAAIHDQAKKKLLLGLPPF